MLILALDTSGPVASCALLRDGELLARAVQDSKLDHSRLLLPLCRQLLTDQDLQIGDVDLFAAVIGPGSFTGIRIGAAAVKGFAWAGEKPCAGISSLLAMACESSEEGVLCCTVKARPGEQYFALFRREGGLVTRLTEDKVGTDQEVAEAMAPYGQVCCLRDCQSAVGAAIAAWDRARAGTLETCHDILPAYLRLSQAERMRKERLNQQ